MLLVPCSRYRIRSRVRGFLISGSSFVAREVEAIGHVDDRESDIYSGQTEYPDLYGE